MEGIFMPQRRKSFIDIGKIYFWTAKINGWEKLFVDDDYKEIVIQSLDFLSSKNKIDVFGFVIMPTHIHLIWRMKGLIGKECPQASFLKHTSHLFKKNILLENPANLEKFAVSKKNKKYEFWHRDSLAIELYSQKIALQKLNYIHNNPVSKKWMLAKEPVDYSYSSANFYENGVRDYPFLKNLFGEYFGFDDIDFLSK